MASHTFWTDLLSEHLDGDLPADRSRALAEHLAGCEDCRAVEAELAEVKRRARALGGIAPPAGLWDSIRGQLDTPPGVVDLTLRLDPAIAPPIAESVAAGWGRKARIAAMIALTLGTGVTGWALGSGALPGLRPAAVEFTALDQPAGVDARLVASAPGGDELSQSVAELERILEGQPEGLDANTVRILRRNLALIQTAVAESRDALATNPENVYVRRHLEGAVERQREFVRQASRLLAADD